MLNIELKTKALSVNALYRGRRFRTKKYDEYEQEVWFQLPKANIEVNKGDKLKISYWFGISKLSDLTNCLKGIEDIISKKYGFNDNQVMETHCYKEVVKKGGEYIKIEVDYLST